MGKPRNLKEIASSGPVIVFGAGGGGDVISAYHVAKRLRELGGKTIIGALVWERYIIDPHPGPLPLSTFLGIEPLSQTSALADGNAVAYRFGRKIIPHAIHLARTINEQVLLLDGSLGAEGLRTGLEAAIEYFNASTVIAVDAGGDILGRGHEEGIWSPLADAMSLYATKHASAYPLIAVHSPGSDGEIHFTTLLKYISEIATDDGLIAVTGLAKSDVSELEQLINNVASEASRIPLQAFKGTYGQVRIRKGTREVEVTPCNVITYVLDAYTVCSKTRLGETVAGTWHIADASRKLNEELCLYTEYDLEKDVARQLEQGVSLEDIDAIKLREAGRARIMSKCKGKRTTGNEV
ncbi:MAG: DUF1152 domain-containing protein [Desulfurococcales archaeon]|nr:DUF1152 domain-containing protein [Desulfurococcales archaeon]